MRNQNKINIKISNIYYYFFYYKYIVHLIS